MIIFNKNNMKEKLSKINQLKISSIKVNSRVTTATRSTCFLVSLFLLLNNIKFKFEILLCLLDVFKYTRFKASKLINDLFDYFC